MTSSIEEMATQQNLIYTICVAIFTLKSGILAAPTVTEDCSIPIHLENTDCCTSTSNVSVVEPVLDQECVQILADSQASSYKELEIALECFFECLFTTIDMLDEENKIVYEEVLANITKDLKPDFANLEINRIKHCIEEDYVTKESSQCQSGSLQFFLCVHREKILNCPAEDWKDSDECNKYKTVLGNCPKRTPIFQLFEFESHEKRNKTE